MAVDPQAYGQPPGQPEPAPPDLGEGVVADQQDPTARPESMPPAPGPDPSVSAKIEVWHAVEALAIAAKAFATGDPLFIEAQRARDFAHGAFYLMQGLALVDPPVQPVDPNLAQADHTRAAAAVLQDQQAKDRVASTERIAAMSAAEGRPAAAHPVGRPRGQTEPLTSKQ